MSQALTVEKPHTAAAYSDNGALAVARGRLSGGAPDVAQKPRTPLSVVPAPPARRRVPFAVFSLLVLGAALTAVLMLNISVSGTQYDLVQLRNQQVALSQQNEALVLEIESRETPQNLAAAATELGMVSSPTFGTVELDSKTVTGTPEPAKEGPEPEVLIAAPNLAVQPAPAPAPAVVEAPSDPVAEEPAPVQAIGPVEGAATAGDLPAVESYDGSDVAGTIPAPLQLGSDR